MTRIFPPLRLGLWMAALFVSLGCSLITANPRVATISGVPIVQLAAPLEGATYLEGVAVNLLARIENAGADVARVEILVDNVIVQTLTDPNPEALATFSISPTWDASGVGAHTIGVTAFRADGSASLPVSRNIVVIGADALNLAVNVAPADAIASGDGTTPTDGTTTTDTTTTTDASPTNTSARNTSATRLGGSFLRGLLGIPAESSPTSPVGSTTTGEPTVEAPLPPADAGAPSATDAPPASAPPTSTPNLPTAVVVQGANVRSGPSTAYEPVLATVQQGQSFTVLAANADRTWYKVQYSQFSNGWIAAALLELRNVEGVPIENVAPPPPTATPLPTAIAATAAPTSNRNITFNGPQGFDPFPPSCRQTMRITLKLQNNGTEALGSGSAAIVRDVHPGSGTRTETTIPIPDIAPGTAVDVTGDFFITVDTNFDSVHRIEVILDINSQITESNEGDNSYTSADYTLAKGSC